MLYIYNIYKIKLKTIQRTLYRECCLFCKNGRTFYISHIYIYYFQIETLEGLKPDKNSYSHREVEGTGLPPVFVGLGQSTNEG